MVMYRSTGRAQLAFPLALVVTLAVALLPAGWRLPWQRDLAEIVQFPMRPFYDAGTMAAGRLRPAPSPASTIGPDQRDVNRLIEERDRAERRSVAEHQRVLELQAQLEQLQQIPRQAFQAVRHPVVARITRRHPDSALGVVELKLPRSMPGVVLPNTPAVYAGVHLVGRVVEGGPPGTCLLLPVVSRETDYIRARVFAKEKPLTGGRMIQVSPTGTGVFTAEVERGEAFVGDRVRLDDPKWTQAAQGMVLGDIEAVDVDDAEPLRHKVIIRPVYQVSQVASVTLLIEQGLESASGERRR